MIELFHDAHAELGEGPMWDPAGQCLYWVDILRGHVHRVDADTRTARVFAVGRMVGSVAPTTAGDLVLAVQGGFARLDPATGQVRPVADADVGRPDIRMNDGACDPAGRFWAGTMALDERPRAGRLYRLDSDGTVHTMLDEVSISNGIDWTDDGARMYYIDTPTSAIDLFDFDLASGRIANRRTFVRIPPEDGFPDGLTLDADGNVWVALWGGSAVHCYAPDGVRQTIVRVPAPYPTSCAFGGADLRDLFITTATIKMTGAERAAQPSAGGVFVTRPGVAGRPPHRFKG